jgi:hypothetical protein
MRAAGWGIVTLAFATLVQSAAAQAGNTSKFIAVGTYAAPAAVPEPRWLFSKSRRP